MQTSGGQARNAIFIDRDGTLIEEVGYLRRLSDLRLCTGATEAVRRINQAGWLAIVLTNQSGVARGLFSESFLAEAHGELQRQLAAAGARVDAFYYCPHLPPGECESVGAGEDLSRYRVECDCRKPKPGLIARAAADFGIEVASSFVIGDRYRDVEMAHAAGAQGVLVLTGYGRDEYAAQRDRWPRQPELVADDLLAAVTVILSSAEKSLRSEV
jgi:D-glycero-D-manno-heptose 1,7-bisphosphate phosphatase